MGKESFRQVFAPNAKTVEELRNKHRKAAVTWLIIALCLLVSTAICLHWMLGEPGQAITDPLVAKIALAGVILEIVAFFAAGIAMELHSIKADYFARQLSDEYIVLNPWERAKYYNYN